MACSPVSDLVFDTGTTAQVCCPTGFTCNHYDFQGDYSAQCFSYVLVSSTITPILIETNVTDGTSVATSLGTSAIDYIVTVAYAGVTVAWEATDTAIVNMLASSSSASLAALAAANSSTVASSPKSSSLATYQQTISSQSTSSNTGSGGLTEGVKAGIGIGVSVGVLLVAAGILLYIRRLKKALKAARGEPEQLKSELSATEKKRLEPIEADTHTAHELAVNEIPIELDGSERWGMVYEGT